MLNPNPFYYWYEFLMRTDEKYWSAYVKEHMVKCETWVEWWEKHGFLFEEPKQSAVDLMHSKEMYEPNDEIAINLIAYLAHPRSDLIEAFTKIIDEHKTVKREPPEWEHLGLYFRLTSKVDTKRMHTFTQILRVYDAVKDKNESTYYQIGVKMGLAPEFDGQNESDSDLKVVMTNTVGRHYKKALEIIANVERGWFPDVPKLVKAPDTNHTKGVNGV